MIRLDRKRSHVANELMGSSNLLELFDHSIMELFRISNNEYDYLCENITDGEMDLFFGKELNFGEKRMLVIMLDKYLTEYNNRVF